jgi:acetyltransferase-like isoleucine patch superfamily enzyme
MNKIYRLLRYDWPLHFVLLLTNWLPDNVFFIRLRGSLASPFFRKCGIKTGIGRNVVFYNPSNIEIGNWVYIAYGCWFSGSNIIIIGDEVLFGPYNVVSSANHSRLNKSFRFGPPVGNPVIFKNGCWVGANCTILPGSIIGEGTVVGANTVVSGRVPDNCVYAGNPAMIKKEFHD